MKVAPHYRWAVPVHLLQEMESREEHNRLASVGKKRLGKTEEQLQIVMKSGTRRKRDQSRITKKL